MGDLTPQFGSDDADGSADAMRVDAALESLLNERGARLRNYDGMIERVTNATLPVIGSSQSLSLIAMRERRVRWGVGLAIAASVVAAVVVTNFPTNRTVQDALSDVVASTDQGGTVAEPVLVSLLAGSELISADGMQEFVVGDASAMPILRFAIRR